MSYDPIESGKRLLLAVGPAVKAIGLLVLFFFLFCIFSGKCYIKINKKVKRNIV